MAQPELATQAEMGWACYPSTFDHWARCKLPPATKLVQGSFWSSYIRAEGPV